MKCDRSNRAIALFLRRCGSNTHRIVRPPESLTMVCRTTTAIQPINTVPTRVDSASDIVLVRSKIRNNSAITPKRGLKLYRLNSAKNTTTIRPVTPGALNRRTSTLRRRLATGLACSVRAFGGPHCAPHKIGIRHRVSSELSRASCPGCGYAQSYGHRALQTRGRGIAAATGNALESLLTCIIFKLRTSYFALQRSDSSPSLVRPPSLAGTRSLKLARSDRPRPRWSHDLVTARRLGGCH